MVCRACGKTAKEGKCNECKSQDLKHDGLLVHDLRRTRVPNLRRIGFTEKTIMEISGHKRRVSGVMTSWTRPTWPRSRQLLIGNLSHS
jgi:hypothetical protein